MSDLRDAFRSLRSTPIVSAVAILSLALGIGANTAIFSILDSLILRALPVKDPQQLAILGTGQGRTDAWTYPIWEEVKRHERLFDGAFAWAAGRFNGAPSGQTEYIDGMWASGRLFEVLGVPAILGRTFTEADDRRGGGPDGPVAVISYGFWQRRFQGAADVIGKTLTVERVPYTIVGVTPPHFFGIDVGRSYDVAIPFGTVPLIRGRESALDGRSTWWLNIMIRLKPEQSLAAGDAAVRGIQPQVRAATMPPDWRPNDLESYLREGFGLLPAANGNSFLRERYRRPLTTIMIVVGLVLLIACANIANLLLARATSRRHELSIRVALGASRWRLARQLLTESLLLSVCGAVAGLLFAQAGSRLLVRQLSTSTNTVFLALGIDWRILGFTAAVAIATAILFGIAPALRGTRVQPNDALKTQGRGIAGDGRVGLGSALVVVQIALSLVLVVVAGLFVRTFTTLAHLDLGFERSGLLSARVDAQYAQLDPAARMELFRRTLEAAASTPGVANAALSAVTPASGSSIQYRVDVPGSPPLGDRERGSYVNRISAGWFRTYGTPLRAGRDFATTDTMAAPKVAIVNEAFARKFFRGQNPVGRRVIQGGIGKSPNVDREIVGYVKDAVYRSLRDPVPPTMYLPYTQVEDSISGMAVTVRAAAGAPMALVRPLAASLTQVHGDITLTFRALEEQVDAVLIQERLVAWLSGFFGGLALLLAGLGLYGVMSYAVSRRRTEIGIRMALGAAPGGVVTLVLRRVAILVGVGTIVGAALSFWASPLIATLLYGLQPRDPLTLAGAIVVLATIGAMAGWLPARRASRIDPATVLRDG